jgi:hypothetical protein
MDPKGKGMVVNDKEKESIFNEPRDDKPTDSCLSHKKKDGKKRRVKKIVYYDSDESSSSPRDDDFDEKKKLVNSNFSFDYSCRRFDPGGSLDRRVNCRRVPQPRWVGARRSAKGGESRKETGVKGETHGLRVCPTPRSGALAVGGYKRPHGREREAYARAVPSFPARPTFCKRALDLSFIGVRRGSRCTIGRCSSVLTCLAERS